jgi:hypothetical protein
MNLLFHMTQKAGTSPNLVIAPCNAKVYNWFQTRKLW